jgi:hypothetical protein
MLALLAAPAGASVSLCPGWSGWSDAVTDIVTTPFTGQAGASAFTWYNDASGITVDSVNYTGYTGDTGVYALKVYNPTYNSTYERGSGPSLGGGYSPGYILITLPAGGVYAVAMDLATETKNRTISITLSTGEVQTITSPSNSTMAFFGFTSDVAITSIRIAATNTAAMIDNFSYGSLRGEETPEPEALVLGATGLVVIWASRRMRLFGA